MITQVVLGLWLILSLWIGWSLPATLLFFPKRKVKGKLRVAGSIMTMVLWPLFVVALVLSFLIELFKSVKKGRMKW